MIFDISAHNVASGPYLIFVRASPPFSEHVDPCEWNLFDADSSVVMETTDAFLMWLPTSQRLMSAAPPPYWCDLVDVVSVAQDAGFTVPALDSEYDDEYDDDHDYVAPFPTMAELVSPGAPGQPEKPCFDKRLVVVVYSDDAEPGRHPQRLRGQLGPGAEIVWHSAEVFGIAFRSNLTPREIIGRTPALSDDGVYTAGVFRVAGRVGLPGAPSPLSLFLGNRQGRSSG